MISIFVSVSELIFVKRKKKHQKYAIISEKGASLFLSISILFTKEILKHSGWFKQKS